MWDYDWGNPSAVMFGGQENYNETLINPHGLNPNQPYNFNPHTQTHFHPLFNPISHYIAPYAPPPIFSLEEIGAGSSDSGCIVGSKNEPAAGVDIMSRIGLNLGGRTYFSSLDDDFLNRFYRQPRVLVPALLKARHCQAEGCDADLTHGKYYYRRHKVCEFHSKAATVMAGGVMQRFCQQCSRFHLLAEFDYGKRSCRKRLADHNRRRRKSYRPYKSHIEIAHSTSLKENHARSPQETSTQPWSSVTTAISPPRISSETNSQQTSYQANDFLPEQANSFFFSIG